VKLDFVEIVPDRIFYRTRRLHFIWIFSFR